MAGLVITFKHFKNMLLGRTKVTMQYPEQKWDSSLPDHYRGAPALVRDEDGRVRCVACQLCEFICPPRAIKIIPGEIPSADRFAKVEKYPEEFDIDMIRCIFCGMCEEVCPEQAIFLRKDYAITGFTRAEMVHHKEKLLEIGGVMHGVVLKWNEKKCRSSRAERGTAHCMRRVTCVIKSLCEILHFVQDDYAVMHAWCRILVDLTRSAI